MLARWPDDRSARRRVRPDGRRGLSTRASWRSSGGRSRRGRHPRALRSPAPARPDLHGVRGARRALPGRRRRLPRAARRFALLRAPRAPPGVSRLASATSRRRRGGAQPNARAAPPRRSRTSAGAAASSVIRLGSSSRAAAQSSTVPTRAPTRPRSRPRGRVEPRGRSGAPSRASVLDGKMPPRAQHVVVAQKGAPARDEGGPRLARGERRGVEPNLLRHRRREAGGAARRSPRTSRR